MLWNDAARVSLSGMAVRASRVERARSEGGAWELANAEPAPALRGLVRGYTGFVECSPVPLRRRELPSGNAVLIVNLGSPIGVATPTSSPIAHTDSFFARVSPLPAITEFTGISSGVQVDFSPLGAHLFMDLPMGGLPEPVVLLEDVLGSDGRRLTEALAAAPLWEERFELLDETIERRFAKARTPKPSIEWAWHMIEASSGRVKIGTLIERLGCSPRHLIEGFREQVGVTPKTAAQIMRVDHAARLMRSAQGGSLARIASECGYYDQAHMTHEFGRLAGVSPTAYAAARRPDFLGVPAD
jgi:AraC-like DNA-binding protein